MEDLKVNNVKITNYIQNAIFLFSPSRAIAPEPKSEKRGKQGQTLYPVFEEIISPVTTVNTLDTFSVFS